MSVMNALFNFYSHLKFIFMNKFQGLQKGDKLLLVLKATNEQGVPYDIRMTVIFDRYCLEHFFIEEDKTQYSIKDGCAFNNIDRRIHLSKKDYDKHCIEERKKYEEEEINLKKIIIEEIQQKLNYYSHNIDLSQLRRIKKILEL